MVTNSALKGADLIINASTGGAPDLFVPESRTAPAPPAGSGAATADACAARVERDGTYTLPRDTRRPLLPDGHRGPHRPAEGHPPPPAGPAKPEVAVWA